VGTLSMLDGWARPSGFVQEGSGHNLHHHETGAAPDGKEEGAAGSHLHSGLPGDRRAGSVMLIRIRHGDGRKSKASASGAP